MDDRKMPLEIDLIETLAAVGEVPVTILLKMAPSANAAWRVLASMLAAKTAALWFSEAGVDRELAEWEVAAILRNRIRQSGEVCPLDDALTIRSTDKTATACDRDFGKWYYGHTPDR